MATKRESILLQVGILAYWSLFWLLNVVDKVVGRPAPFFAGRDRAAQLIDYFSSIGVSDPWILSGTLVVITFLEVIAFLYIFGAFVVRLKGDKHRAHHLFFRGTLTGLLLFGLFSIGDQVFGDRFELLEHTLYWMAIIASWAAYIYFPRREAK